MIVKWLKLSLVALFGFGFIALILYVVVMKDSIRHTSVEPPLIMAAEEPVKRHPEQPGGLLIPDQDKLVFDLLDDNGNIASGSVVETVAAEVVDDDVEAKTEEADAVAETQVDAASAAVEEKTVAEASTESVVTVSEQPVVQPVAENASGDWGVQLGSVRVEADARAALGKLENQFAVLKSLSGRVQAAEVKGSTSHRIQFIGLDSRDAASRLCAQLKPQACLPVAK